MGSDWRASSGWTSSSERAWKKTRTYTTVDDWKTEIDVVVYEGERAQSMRTIRYLGRPKCKQGEPKVDVTFALDANGILQVGTG